jgi:hypothetical protein
LNVTFWVGVAMAYVVIVALGLSFGRYLGDRFRHGNGGGRIDPVVTPTPTGPTHAVEFPPLGSAFDRALLPGVFDEPVRERAA